MIGRPTDTPVAGSFRDPAGHVFSRDGVIHRRVEPAGAAAFHQMLSSGLYGALVGERLLVSHDDLGPDPRQPGAATVLRPQQIPMISYPYEWSLSQLRDAALVTLRAQQLAVRFGMTLKDASAYNVQFLAGRPILIDTLSFEPYGGGPWLAYRQFCQHFYAPLLLGATRDARLLGLSRQFIDGPPLGLVSSLLPRRSWLRPGPLLHVHLHARAESRWAARDLPAPQATATRTSRSVSRIEALTHSLDRAVAAVTWPTRSVWSDYYADKESYTPEAFAEKTRVVTDWLDRLRPSLVWDLGANTGHFSKLAAGLGATTVAFDGDAACVDALYRTIEPDARPTVLPLVLDLANPSPGLGWANTERMTLESRGPADLLLVLAVTHHLAIGNNVPLTSLASWLARLGRRAIVEFVPKADPMVAQMLRARADIFDDYTESGFQQALDPSFIIDERVPLAPSRRSLYLLRAR